MDGPWTYTGSNFSPERTSHMVVISCFQSCLWSCLLLFLTGSLDKLCAWFISLLCLGLMLDSVISSMTSPLWLGRALPSECSEHSWLLFPVGWSCSLCFPVLLPCGDSKQWRKGVVMIKKTNKQTKPKSKTLHVGQENTKILMCQGLVNFILPEKIRDWCSSWSCL